VTNVTSLNRTNQRRVLIFIGNGNGMISYGMGKADEYEAAFENAFKIARQNLICINIDETFTSPRVLQGRHNDFAIKIFPQQMPNYWGNP
jgi:ribosomal protein S5